MADATAEGGRSVRGFSGDRVSVLQDANILKTDGGAGRTIV